VIRHAGRAVPWALLAIGLALIAASLRAVEEWPYRVWPLQGMAVGLLAGLAVWCFDEPAAAVVDTLPRCLAWRTAARATGLAVLLAGWVLCVHWTSTAYFGKPGHVAWQGVGAVLAGTAWATWRRSLGVAMPARPAATASVCGAAYLALARPLEDLLPVFPYTTGGAWTSSAAVWAGVAAASVTLLGIVLTETRWPQPGASSSVH
jgi:hypothetical protein